MNAKKTCLAYIVMLIAIGAFLNWLFARESPIPHFLPSAFGSLVITFGLLYLHGALNHAGELKMVKRSLSFEPFEDGERIAVVGSIAPLGEPIETPFTRSSAVASEYEIFRWVSRGKSTTKEKAFFGFALCPSAIATSRGRVAILAWPDLDFDATPLASENDYASALRYIDGTQFKQFAGGDMKERWSELEDLIADDDGSIRKDYATEVPDFDIRKYSLSEKTLAIGENVCAFGRFSVARGGLVPDPKTLAHGISILRGDADAVMRTVRRRLIGYAIGGSVVTALGIAGVVIYLRWLKTTTGVV